MAKKGIKSKLFKMELIDSEEFDPTYDRCSYCNCIINNYDSSDEPVISIDDDMIIIHKSCVSKVIEEMQNLIK